MFEVSLQVFVTVAIAFATIIIIPWVRAQERKIERMFSSLSTAETSLTRLMTEQQTRNIYSSEVQSSMLATLKELREDFRSIREELADQRAKIEKIEGIQEERHRQMDYLVKQASESRHLTEV